MGCQLCEHGYFLNAARQCVKVSGQRRRSEAGRWQWLLISCSTWPPLHTSPPPPALAPPRPLPQCSDAMPGCDACRGLGQCVQCEDRKWPGLGLVAGHCQPCKDVNCANCDGNPAVCRRCINDPESDGLPFVMDPRTRKCVAGLPPPSTAAAAQARRAAARAKQQAAAARAKQQVAAVATARAKQAAAARAKQAAAARAKQQLAAARPRPAAAISKPSLPWRPAVTLARARPAARPQQAPVRPAAATRPATAARPVAAGRKRYAQKPVHG